jgi:hypothetical protein
MRASSANILKSTAPPQGTRSLQIRRVVGSAPPGSTARLNLGADLAATTAFFMANPPLATSAGGGFLSAVRANSPSVISVTYGVVLRMPEHFQNQCINPVDSSERHEFWFRKARILVPKGTNSFSMLKGSRKHERRHSGYRLGHWFPIARILVPDSTNMS